MLILTYAIVIIIGYFMGCIQSAYIIGKTKKIDIREHGSKNAGASNAFVTLGWKYGVLVGLIDILKAAIPVFIVTMLFKGNTTLAIVCGVSVAIGHIFPVFLKFRGGKGTACIVGLMFGLHPVLFLVAALSIIIVTIISDYIAIGTFVMLGVIIITMFILSFSYPSIGIFTFLCLLNVFKHRNNISNIISGTEKGLRETLHRS